MKEYTVQDIVDAFGECFENRTNTSDGFKCLSIINNENTPSMTIDIINNRFNCFSSGIRGNHILLLEALFNGVKSPTILQQENFLNQYTETKKPKSIYTSCEKKLVNIFTTIADIALYNRLNETDIPKEVSLYLKKRKIDDEIYFINKVGYIKNSQKIIEHLFLKFEIDIEYLKSVHLVNENGILYLEDCIIFPIFDKHNNITGFNAKPMNKKIKYLNPPKLDTSVYKNLNVNSSVYQGYSTYKAVNAQNTLIFVEGVFDLLQLANHGIKNVVALNGKNISEDKEKLLLLYKNEIDVRKIIEFLDIDVSFEEKLLLYKKLALLNFSNISSFKYPDSEIIYKDPDELFSRIYELLPI